jgi:hypothetical protein
MGVVPRLFEKVTSAFKMCQSKNLPWKSSTKGFFQLKGFSLLEMGLRANWLQISEIPPRPPLIKGGWGAFREIHPYANMAFLVPAWSG